MNVPIPSIAAIYYHSLVHLRPSMIAWRVHRAVKSAAIAVCERAGVAGALSRPRSDVRTRRLPVLGSRYHCESVDLEARSFSFLRDSAVLPADRDARRRAVTARPLLWQFHYSYHDYLLALHADGRATTGDIMRFVREWDADHPLALRRARKSAWHAYVLSLRIEAWIRLHGLLCGEGKGEEDPDIRFLARGVEHMTRVLLRNLERGTMANHFLKNVKALVLAGRFLEGPTGARAHRTGMRALAAELAEQVLDDGMHFERSPMYHAQMTSDVLDLFELAALLGEPVPPALAHAARAMTDFLARAMHPDGDIPYLNDATASFFIDAREVLARGTAVCAQFGLAPRPGAPDPAACPPAGTIDPARHSGLLFMRSADMFVVFDAGNVGPDYQPGHAHCDTLSYEASWKGVRVLTDTGVFHYRESPERTHARSTAAHSTLRIDGAEQSEIWKSFRVGRRARILRANDEERDGLRIFTAAHDGYTRLAPGLVHERTLAILPDAWMVVIDIVRGEGAHRIENFIQIAPGCRVTTGKHGISVETPVGVFAIAALDRMQAEVQRTEYYPAFGVKEHRSTVILRGDATLPFITGCSIVFDPARAPQVGLDAARLQARIACGPHTWLLGAG